MNQRADCPDDETLHAVLDRSTAEHVATGVRAHVQECESCLARRGDWFELELWAPRLEAPLPTPTAEPLAVQRLFERIAVAAALVALAWFAARIPANADRSDECRVLELEWSESSTGPEGSVAVRHVFDPDGARRGAAALTKLEEVRTGRDGVAVVHERFLPRHAAFGE